ncbi:class I SAM-dependent methyltransferase [Williamsia serinedens]|uniref:Methyltransferase domain-containing protein n=1 Tax=Williamsia serinedens TaxID=391736 RepID=A0ABT1GWK9_9NOCA|nr:class I SAM-dependent methyltransferase [Williamsia serinedens]MCP2159377.1 Methyltransferase domain-containing protein [Williamsia serinedens]
MGFQQLQDIVDDARANGQYVEGSANATELAALTSLASTPGIRRVVEIGFNAGFSSHAFLSAHPDIVVTSFDLGEHSYGSRAKAQIDQDFPGRHTLITGDSLTTVPAFAEAHPGETFDLIFIDGGHSYEVASADIRNMARVADSDTVVVIDDLLPHRLWGEGVIKAWDEAIATGVVAQTTLYADGAEVDVVGPDAARAWAVGRYL